MWKAFGELLIIYVVTAVVVVGSIVALMILFAYLGPKLNDLIERIERRHEK